MNDFYKKLVNDYSNLKLEVFELLEKVIVYDDSFEVLKKELGECGSLGMRNNILRVNYTIDSMILSLAKLLDKRKKTASFNSLIKDMKKDPRLSSNCEIVLNELLDEFESFKVKYRHQIIAHRHKNEKARVKDWVLYNDEVIHLVIRFSDKALKVFDTLWPSESIVEFTWSHGKRGPHQNYREEFKKIYQKIMGNEE